MSLFVSVCIFTGCILKINSQESFSDGVNNFFLARVTSSCEHKYAFKNKLNDFQEKSSRDSFSCKLIQKEQFDVYERRDGMHLVASSAWLCIHSCWLSSAAVPSLCSSFIRINQSSSISNFLRKIPDVGKSDNVFQLILESTGKFKHEKQPQTSSLFTARKDFSLRIELDCLYFSSTFACAAASGASENFSSLGIFMFGF